MTKRFPFCGKTKCSPNGVAVGGAGDCQHTCLASAASLGIKGGIVGVEILGVEVILRDAQSLAETINMKH